MEPVQGRGWAALEGDELKGEIFSHQGEDSGFIASAARQRSRKARRKWVAVRFPQCGTVLCAVIHGALAVPRSFSGSRGQ